MKNFIYAIKQVFRLKMMNFVKLISITLGIVVSGALMCRVAFEQSYDNFYPDVNRLNMLYMHYHINGKDLGFQRQCLAPMAPELRSKMPEVSAATRFVGYSKNWYQKNNEPIELSIAEIDTSFFDVFRFPIVVGNPKDILTQPNSMMLTVTAAQRLFPGEDCIGKQIIKGDQKYTILGIFEDIPANSHIEPMDGVVSLVDFREDWNGGDAYFTYFRTSKDVTTTYLTKTVNELFAPRFTNEATQGIAVDFKVENIRTEYADSVRDSNMIMFVLALIVLLVAGFNFVLLSITSLTSRAKEIGVHKANGANSTGIFTLIIWESIIYIFLSLICAAIIFWGAKVYVENIIGLYENVFALENMWALMVMLVVIVIVGGVIPAAIFAKIPVTQVFQRFTAVKARWKIALLFIQFTSTVFVLSYLAVIVGQYNTLMKHDLGYNHEKLIYVNLTGFSPEEKQVIINELRPLSFIENMTTSSQLIPNFGGGYGVQSLESDQRLFSSDLVSVDSNYVALHEIKLLSGSQQPRIGEYDEQTKTHTRRESFVVNETFIRKMGIVDKQVTSFRLYNQVFDICGVVADFQTTDLKNEIAPLIMCSQNPQHGRYLTIKLTQLTADNFKSIEAKIKQLYPVKGFKMESYDDMIAWAYIDARMFRDAVIMSAIVLIIISILGIIGYVANEIKRRSREIAVRKVFGSSVAGVIMLVLRNLLILITIASVVAIPLAYMVSEAWVSGYNVKMLLHWWLFVGVAAVVIFIVIIFVTMQTWKIAVAPPSEHLKSE